MRKFLIIALMSLFALGFAQDGNPDLTIVQGLAESEEYSTLISLLQTSGLDQELEAGEFTLFAPINDAFDDLSDEALAQLTDNPDLLNQVLLGHVVEGAYGVNDLQDAEEGSIVSLQGEPLEFGLGAGGLGVNGAPLDSTDVEFSYSNGIAHGVGAVVLPVSMQEYYAENEMFDVSMMEMDDAEMMDEEMTDEEMMDEEMDDEEMMDEEMDDEEMMDEEMDDEETP